MHEKEVKNQAEHDELPVDTNEEANPVYQEENLQPREENVESDGNETEKIKAELSEQKNK